MLTVPSASHGLRAIFPCVSVCVCHPPEVLVGGTDCFHLGSYGDVTKIHPSTCYYIHQCFEALKGTAVILSQEGVFDQDSREELIPTFKKQIFPQTSKLICRPG